MAKENYRSQRGHEILAVAAPCDLLTLKNHDLTIQNKNQISSKQLERKTREEWCWRKQE